MKDFIRIVQVKVKHIKSVNQAASLKDNMLIKLFWLAMGLYQLPATPLPSITLSETLD